MTSITDLGALAWRDWITDGVGSSGARRVPKADARAVMAAIDVQKGEAVADLAALKAVTSRPGIVVVQTGQAAGVWQWAAGSSTTADDALVVTPTTGPAGRYKRIENVLLGPRWFGGVGDGVTDDTDALQAACDYQAARGGGKVDLTGGKWLLDSADLALGRNVVLSGPWLMPGTGAGALRIDISEFNSTVLVNPAYTIRAMDDSAGIEGLAIFNKDVFDNPTPTNLRENLDRVKLFAGVGITIGDGTNTKADDCSIRNCFIGGFEYGIYSDFSSRPRIDSIFGDNHNGIYITRCYDMNYISNVHFWPALTPSGGETAMATYTVAGVTDNGSGLIRIETSTDHILVTGDANIVVNGVGGVSAANGTWNVTRVDATHFDLQGSTFGGSYTSGGSAGVLAFKRAGIGIHCDTDTDWGQLTTCFCYGYQVAGIKVENSNYTTLNNCGADNYAPLEDAVPVGIWIAGTSKAASLIGCKAAAQGSNLRIETSGLYDEDVAMVTNFRSWGAVNYIYDIVDGTAIFLNCHGQTGETVRVGANASAPVIVGGNFLGVTFSYATNAPRVSFMGARGGSSPHRIASTGVSGNRKLAEYSSFNTTPTADDGFHHSYYITNSNGAEIEAGRFTMRLSNVTAGAEVGQIIWGTMLNGVLANSLLLTSSVIAPVTNAGLGLGTSALQFSGADFANGATIGFNARAYTIIHTTGKLSFSGPIQVSPGASVTPANNGQVTFELTNNTTLTFKARGSDGTVRSGTVALT